MWRSLSLVLATGLLGCAPPVQTFSVTDVTTGKHFLTHRYDRIASVNPWNGAMTGSGAVLFRDLETGDEVTLQNSAIHTVKTPSPQ